MKNLHLLALIAASLLNIGFAVQDNGLIVPDEHNSTADTRPVNCPGLNSEQSRVFLEAIENYMQSLNQTCRYTEVEEISYRLPEKFFEVYQARKGVKFGVRWKADTSLAGALDKLSQVNMPEAEKYITDCTFAAHCCILQGFRAVLGDDEIFDRVFHKQSASEVQKKDMDNLFTEITVRSDQFVLGGICFFEQLSDLDSYTHGVRTAKSLRLKNLEEVLSLFKWQHPYDAKHNALTFKGLNVVMIAPEECVFFEPGTARMTTCEAINRMMDDMDADLNEAEIEDRDITEIGLKLLNSIKYKSRKSAAEQILQKAVYLAPNFAKLFKQVEEVKAEIEAETVKKEFCNQFIREHRKNPGSSNDVMMSLLASLKVLSLDQKYSLLSSLDSSCSTDQLIESISAFKTTMAAKSRMAG